VGVGPGDPELMTVKAIRVTREADVVFAAGHERSGKSLAWEIAAPHFPDDAAVTPLPFPHTFDSVDGRSPHREAAGQIVAVLRDGKSAAFLTLGDPMTFSTFTYVLEAVRELEQDVPVQIIPGITSFAAAAAATATPLAEGEETLAIVGAAKSTDALEAALTVADNLVIMKPYRQTDRVCTILAEEGLAEQTWHCIECSRTTERIERGLEAAKAGEGKYMSLFLVRKAKPGASE
jgi:precorrin-2/cobalt-factor-2 C20-methyltransferase